MLATIRSKTRGPPARPPTSANTPPYVDPAVARAHRSCTDAGTRVRALAWWADLQRRCRESPSCAPCRRSCRRRRRDRRGLGGPLTDWCGSCHSPPVRLSLVPAPALNILVRSIGRWMSLTGRMRGWVVCAVTVDGARQRPTYAHGIAIACMHGLCRSVTFATTTAAPAPTMRYDGHHGASCPPTTLTLSAAPAHSGCACPPSCPGAAWLLSVMCIVHSITRSQRSTGHPTAL